VDISQLKKVEYLGILANGNSVNKEDISSLAFVTPHIEKKKFTHNPNPAH
jgi:hypothetical protein